MLAAWLVLGAGYFALLNNTTLSDHYWLPVVLALNGVLVLAAIQGLLLVWKMSTASKRPTSDWRDGQLVGFSGRVQARSTPLTTPISGKPAVICEYEISRKTGSGKNSRIDREIVGMLMTACNVTSPRGQLRLVGFPILNRIKNSAPDDESDLQHFSEFLYKTKFEQMEGSPLKILNQLADTLADEDGVVERNFTMKPYLFESSEGLAEELEEEEVEAAPSAGTAAVPIKQASPGDDPKRASIMNYLNSGNLLFEERFIPNGVVVTAFGTYNAAKGTLDVGSGMKRLDHQLHLGEIDAVLRKEFTKCFILLCLWAGIWVAGHYYLSLEVCPSTDICPWIGTI